VDLSACAPYRWERFEIHGSEASLRWDETGYRLWRLVAGRDPEELAIPAELALVRKDGEPALAAPFRVMVEQIRRALDGEGPMEPNFDDAVAVQSALDAARLSSEAATRIDVQIPPETPDLETVDRIAEAADRR
jgi:predicted dehydrogenase